MEQKQSHWKTSSFQPSRQPSSAQHRWCGACIWVELWCTLSSALKQKQWHLSPPYLWAHTGPTMKSLCTLHDLLVVGQALRGMETEKTCSLPPGNPKSHREDRQVPRDGHRVLCDENNNEESGSGCSCLCRWSWAGGHVGGTPSPYPSSASPGPQDTWLAFRAEEEFQKKLRICTFLCTSLPRWIGSVSMLLAFSKDRHLKAELPRQDLAFSFWSLSSLSARPRTCRPISTSCENPRWEGAHCFLPSRLWACSLSRQSGLPLMRDKRARQSHQQASEGGWRLNHRTSRQAKGSGLRRPL